MKKFIAIVFTALVASLYYFPFEFYAFPGYNTKKVMAAVGVLVCLFKLMKKGDTEVPRNLIPLFLGAAVVSLVGLVSMTINRTIDDAYSGYLSSMAVWLSAAFVVCCLIKAVHGKVTVEIVCNYIIIVCLFQCITSQMIDNMPAFQKFVDTYINVDQRTLHRIDRLYGIGASLDVAGIRFSVCLIMITYLLRRHASELSITSILLYVASYIIIVVLGSMIARTTYVGVAMSAALLVCMIDYKGAIVISRKAAGVMAALLVLIGVFVAIGVYEYNHNPTARHLLRFAFEGAFNYFETGNYRIASNETLKSMIVFPESFKTWVIGDGYFSNPYWSDPNYLWQGQNRRGFYMGTDIGYLRFIFYFGVIGLLAFSWFLWKATKTCMELIPGDAILFLFILLAGFVIWLKVSTDIFLALALFICVGNMQDPPPEEDTEEIEE